MNDVDIGLVLRDTLMVIAKLAGPPLLVGLIVGVVVSLLQTIMQVNEATVTFVPKVLAIGAVLALTGPFIVITLTNYSHVIFDQLVAVGGQ
jgi:flagellar biosynthetic protein FliQ